jgi:hypothetical protein
MIDKRFAPGQGHVYHTVYRGGAGLDGLASPLEALLRVLFFPLGALVALLGAAVILAVTLPARLLVRLLAGLPAAVVGAGRGAAPC